MRGPLSGEPDASTRAAEEEERTRCGIAADDWETAFEWADADGGWVEDQGKHPPASQADEAALPFKVWRSNWEAVGLFLACETQWHKDAMGQADGLRYPGVEVVMRRKKVKDKDAMFDKLQLMEAAALEVLRG